MADSEGIGLLLGSRTPVPQRYAPHILHPIPRATGRDGLDLHDPLPFYGEDLWHAYEMSWLDNTGKPVARVGRFRVPASSPSIIESKSFKLYLNSLNSARFASIDEAAETIVADVSRVAGAQVSLDLVPVGDGALAGGALAGKCIDALAVVMPDGEPHAGLLRVKGGREVEEAVHSHLLRSLCPVTGQPDWASVWLHYCGAPLEHDSLLQYLLAYREHQEFHEQCVERMFRDISQACAPRFLHVQAFYTRRGGLDINPFRSTDHDARALPRLDRQ